MNIFSIFYYIWYYKKYYSYVVVVYNGYYFLKVIFKYGNKTYKIVQPLFPKNDEEWELLDITDKEIDI